MALHNWFVPHKETHKKAHLISWEGLLIYILFFILLQVGFSIINFTKPGVLGITGNIDQKRLIELTNIERQKNGLSPVSENGLLDQAAALKAQNMFAENYWAHFSPSGKSPWDFILGAGYKFSFAGENLAKNFTNSEDVVNAWMASPTHRDNILNSKYKDIGIAVIEGNLNGQQTILVVQEFGATQVAAVAVKPTTTPTATPKPIEKPTVSVQGKQIEISKEEYNNKPTLVAAAPLITPVTQVSPSNVLVDPFKVYKTVGFSVLGLIVVLLALDIWLIRRRGVLRLTSHHLAHMALLSLTAGSLFMVQPGAVLGINTDKVFNFFNPGPAVLNILSVGILIYLLWALFHHKRDKSLTLHIFLEYLLTAALSLVMLTGAII